jgi:5-methyltetrahydrofolate--homocysteine methyltransferase
MDDILLALARSITEGDMGNSSRLTAEALEAGFTAEVVLQNGLIPGIRETGALFGAGEIYLPELLVSGLAMESSVKLLEPVFGRNQSAPRGRFLIGTVAGDLHDIGKNIVVMMLKGSGWEVTDLGIDVSPERFCEAVQAGDYDILGLSALLTTTMESVVLTMDALKENGLREKIRIIIGGAPVDQLFADQVGADAYGADGWDAVVKAERLIGIQ